MPWNKIQDQYTDLPFSRYKKWSLRHPEKVKECNRNSQQNHPELHRKAQTKYSNNHPEIIRAHNCSNHHVPLGKECELCPEDDKRTENLERHHPDYNYPEIIVTVCKECHELQKEK